jgi:subtilisin family serine protease
MKKLLLGVALFTTVLGVQAQTVYQNYQDGKIWFKVKKDYRILSSLEEQPSKLPVSTLPFLNSIEKGHSLVSLSKPFHSAKDAGLQRTYLLKISDKQNVDQVIAQLVASGAVEYAEKVPIDRKSLTPNDPSYSSQWGLTKISAPAAWNYFSSGSNIVVAIVDDAVERTHPDLNPSLWINTGDNTTNGIDDDGNGYIDDINGWDVGDNDNNPNPTTLAYDHGTHVAGIVGATSNNNTGVASIGYSVKLMAVKATDNASSVSDGYAGIIYAVDNGADVINMSWGGYTSSTTGQNVINYAHNAGVVLIAAAGNDNLSTMLYPAGYNWVISVAASASNDAKASFSNYGNWIDVTAPGANIYSTTVNATYGNKSGTSMASPMVAGLAGLMLSLNPSLTTTDIENCIKNNTDNINAMNGSYIGQLGTGRINANLSMQCVSATLNWPPVADFVANTTTVTAGGSVSFTNLSVYNPTSYTWSFQSGTPASSNLATPPSIVYNTPGTYSVSLTATNANGSDVETKVAYITVVAASGCTKINFPAPGTWTATQYYTGATVGQDGWVNGVNVYGDKEKAMYFDASASPYTQMVNLWLAFGKAYSSNSAKIVPIKVYDGRYFKCTYYGYNYE